MHFSILEIVHICLDLRNGIVGCCKHRIRSYYIDICCCNLNSRNDRFARLPLDTLFSGTLYRHRNAFSRIFIKHFSLPKQSTYFNGPSLKIAVCALYCGRNAFSRAGKIANLYFICFAHTLQLFLTVLSLKMAVKSYPTDMKK